MDDLKKNSEGYTDLTAYEAIKRDAHERREFTICTPTLDITVRAFGFFPCDYTTAKFLFRLIGRYCNEYEIQSILSWLYDHQAYTQDLKDLQTLIKNIMLFKSLTRKDK